MMPEQDIRTVLLEIVSELTSEYGLVQQVHVFDRAKQRIDDSRDIRVQEAILNVWNDLFRTGILAWGSDLTNCDPPFFHPTERGQDYLKRISRNPHNPLGYLQYINDEIPLNPISYSYLEEAIYVYNASHIKSAAVMVGAASESILLDTRDKLIEKMESLGLEIPRALSDWRLLTFFNAMKEELDKRVNDMPRELRESYRAFFSGFLEQVMRVRNEAGHPTSIEPVQDEAVYASLLIFPEQAKLANDLQVWIDTIENEG